MSSIPPATISFQPTAHSSESLKGIPSPPIFSRGEVLAAEVSEKLDGGRFLLTLKNVAVNADSEIPLNAGDRLMVRVEQVQPRIVLSVIANETPETAIIDDCLKMHRADPDSLITLIREAGVLLNSKNLGELTRSITGRDIKGILGLIDKMVFSSGNLKDSLFVKDFVSRLGLLWESDLKKLIQESSGGAGVLKNRDNLKSLLMKLSVDLQALKQEEALMDSEAVGSLNKLVEFADKSIKSIEIQQVVNVVAQESGGAYMLQVPFSFSEGVRTGDIFIEGEEEKSGKDGGGRYAVVIFLSMDALGDMMIEARISGDEIGCLIKCDNDEVRDFISASAEGLEKQLSSLGYKTDRLTCLAGENLQQMKYEYLKDHGIYGRDVMDFFV